MYQTLSQSFLNLYGSYNNFIQLTSSVSRASIKVKE